MAKKKIGIENDVERVLRTLVMVVNELSRAESVDTLCRRVVELGRTQLGFDRLSIWFIDKDKNYITGSYGFDDVGQLRYEEGQKILISEHDEIGKIHRSHRNRNYSILETEVSLRDHKGIAIGKGSCAIAAIWNGTEVIGYLYTDNLLQKRPIAEKDRELLELYASTFGHIYALKSAEEAWKEDAYNKLRTVQEELSQSARTRLGGEVVSGAIHEVKNPLMIILQGVEYLSFKMGHENGKINSTLEAMKDAVGKANNVVMELLDFSKLARLELTGQDLDSVIESSLALVKHQMEGSGIELVKDFQNNLPLIKIDKDKVERALVNIFLNAFHSMSGGGTLSVKTYSGSSDSGEKAVFCDIEDTGTGIPKAILDKISKPFFTTKGKSGTGMGLSVVKNIMELHGGILKIENKKEGRGVMVTLIFRA